MTVRSWRELVSRADPDFTRESRDPVAYEFGMARIKKRGITAETGAYAGRKGHLLFSGQSGGLRTMTGDTFRLVEAP